MGMYRLRTFLSEFRRSFSQHRHVCPFNIPVLLSRIRKQHLKDQLRTYRDAEQVLVTLLYVAVSVWGQDFKCPQKDGYYPDPIQCDLYFHCSRGEVEEKLCPDGLLFDDSNPSHERCDTSVNVECGDRTELRKQTQDDDGHYLKQRQYRTEQNEVVRLHKV